jgi:hypothetical protein
MADQAETTQNEEKPFDSKAFIEQRNAGKPAENPAPGKPADKPAEKPAEGAAAGGEDRPREPRSVRRERNRLLREIGEVQGVNKMLQEQIAQLRGDKPAAEEKAGADPEPVQKDFADYAEYTRAIAAWSARQETGKVLKTDRETTQQQEAIRQHLRAMRAKADQDMETLPDWKEVSEAAKTSGPKFKADEHPQLMGLIANSDVQAFVLYHFAKDPDELKRMLSLTEKPADQIRAFHRLEGRIDKLYGTAAQAGEGNTSKDRNSQAPEKTAQAAGASAADRDIRKAKPSSEVAARGGAAPLSDPPIGSEAWMLRRNQAEFGR